MKTSPRFYSPKEVARILGTTRRTLRRWELSGVIPPGTTALGRKKWPAATINQFVASLATGRREVS